MKLCNTVYVSVFFQVLKYLDYIFTGVFTFEMVIKVLMGIKITVTYNDKYYNLIACNFHNGYNKGTLTLLPLTCR